MYTQTSPFPGQSDSDARPENPSVDAAPHDDDHHSHPHHGPSPFVRLMRLFKPEMRDIIVIATYAILVGLLSLATPVTALAVVNTTAMATLLQQLIILCLALMVSLAIAALIQSLQSVVLEYLQRRIFVRVVQDLAFRLPRAEIHAFDHQHGPELVNRFFDVLTVQKTSASLLLDGLSILLQMAIGLILLATYHQYLLGFDLVLIFSLILIVFVLGRGAVRTSIDESIAKYAVASWLQEMARHPGAFKLHGASDFAFTRADKLSRTYLDRRHRHFSIVLRQIVFSLALQAVTSVALLGLGGYLVIQGELTLGQLVAAEIVVALVVASFTKLGKQLENYYDLLAAVDKLGHLTDLSLERLDGVPFQPKQNGSTLKLHNLAFHYRQGHRNVFTGLHLEIQSGERVAILGPNGSGKSTLIELLVGLRTPTTGFIEIDGQDVRTLNLESLRKHVALAKGIEIFEGTLLDNVRMGRDDLSIASVQEALSKVRLLHDIQEFPLGINTLLGTGGSPLSLGQAERLMLARAIAGRPKLLILDELLDDMDASVRQAVLPAIMGKDSPWTLLVITHSDDVSQLCDRSVRIHRSNDDLSNLPQ